MAVLANVLRGFEVRERPAGRQCHQAQLGGAG